MSPFPYDVGAVKLQPQVIPEQGHQLCVVPDGLHQLVKLDKGDDELRVVLKLAL